MVLGSVCGDSQDFASGCAALTGGGLTSNLSGPLASTLPVHLQAMRLECVAGPDWGCVLGVDNRWVVVGRADGLRDRSTSRRHCRVRVAPHSRRARCGDSPTQLLLEVVDCGSVNGTFRVRHLHLLPGFARRYLLACPVQTAFVRPGESLLVGANLWRVTQNGAFVTAAQLLEGPRPRVSMRQRWSWWLVVLPLLSVGWFVGRWLGVFTASFVAAAIVAAVVYVVGARWSRGADCSAVRVNLAADLVNGGGVETVGARDGGAALRLPSRFPVQVAGGPVLHWWRCGRFRWTRFPRHRGRWLDLKSGARVRLRGENCWQWGRWLALQVQLWLCLAGAEAKVRLEPEVGVITLSAGGQLVVQILTGNADQPCEQVVTVRSRAPRVTRLPGGEGTAGLAQRVQLGELRRLVASGGADVPRGSGQVGGGGGASRLVRDGLRATVALSEAGPVTLDLVRDGPHALIAGTTGSGKSEALRTWLTELTDRYSSSALRLVLIDYKGGAGLAEFAHLDHCEGLFTDLDAALTARVFHGLAAELRSRERRLAGRQWADLAQWEAVDPLTAPPRIVCVVDEFRAMVRTHPELLDQCVDLAARGRSLGIHLLAATQSPSGVVSGAMRANLSLRIAFRCAQTLDSVEMLGDESAAQLPRIAGRAIIEGAQRTVVQWALAPGVARGPGVASLPRQAGGGGQAGPELFGRVSSPTLWVPALSRGEACELVAADAGVEGAFGVGEGLYGQPRVVLEGNCPVAVLAPRDKRSAVLGRCCAAWRECIWIGTCPPSLGGGGKGGGGSVDSAGVYPALVHCDPLDPLATISAMRAASYCAVAVVVEDLPRLLDSWRAVTPAPESLWEEVSRKLTAGLLVGVEVEETKYVRDFSRRLVCHSAAALKLAGAAVSVVAAMEDAVALARSQSEIDEDIVTVASHWDSYPPLRVVFTARQGVVHSAREAVDTRLSVLARLVAVHQVDGVGLGRHLAWLAQAGRIRLGGLMDFTAACGGPADELPASLGSVLKVPVIGQISPGLRVKLAEAELGQQFNFEFLTEVELLSNPLHVLERLHAGPWLCGYLSPAVVRQLKLPVEYSAWLENHHIWLANRDVGYRIALS